MIEMPVMNHKLLFGLCKMADDHVIVVMNAFELYVFLEIHTAVAGSHRAIEKATADVCGTGWVLRAERRRPAEKFFTQTAQRARGDFGGVNVIGGASVPASRA